MQYVRFPHKHTGYHISQSLEAILVFMVMLDKSGDKRVSLCVILFLLRISFYLGLHRSVSLLPLFHIPLFLLKCGTLLLILQSLTVATGPSLMASINLFSWYGEEGRIKAVVEKDNLQSGR